MIKNKNLVFVSVFSRLCEEPPQAVTWQSRENQFLYASPPRLLCRSLRSLLAKTAGLFLRLFRDFVIRVVAVSSQRRICRLDFTNFSYIRVAKKIFIGFITIISSQWSRKCAVSYLIDKPIYRYFDAPRSIKVGDKSFENICSTDTRRYMQNGMMQSNNYLVTHGNIEHYVHEQNGKVDYVATYYRQPVTKTIGGNVYNNIMREIKNYETGITRYDNFNRNDVPTIIKVNHEGKVMSIQKPFFVTVGGKISGMFRKIFKSAGHCTNNLIKLRK